MKYKDICSARLETISFPVKIKLKDIFLKLLPCQQHQAVNSSTQVKYIAHMAAADKKSIFKPVLNMWCLGLCRIERDIGKTVSVTEVNAARSVSAIFVFPSQHA